MPKKIYDYNADKVKTALVDSFKRRSRSATVADLVADTALPRVQVEEQLPAVADEFGARLKVTESGEILYSFPSGLKSRYKGFGPGLKRFLKAFGRGAKKAATLLFKIWIAVMLVGYFVFFILLLVLFLVFGIAAQASDKERSRGDGGIGLIGSILNAFIRIWFYSEFFKSTDPYYQNARYAQRQERKKRPLYKAIYSFVFGDGDPNANWPELERKAVIAYLRQHQGLITLEEFMALTGLSPENASNAINSYCLEFEGEPEVSDDGVVYYRFKSIMRGVDVVYSPSAQKQGLLAKRIEPFSATPKKANAWFCVMNGVNLLFGGFFTYGTFVWGPLIADPAFRIAKGEIAKLFYYFTTVLFSAVSANPVPVVFGALGVMPLVFAALFYLVPALRKINLDKKNEDARFDNLRRVTYGRAWATPLAVEPVSTAGLPDAVVPKDSQAGEKLIKELAGYTEADVQAKPGSNGFVYSFPEMQRSKAAIGKLRGAVDEADFDLGKVIFDSDSTDKI
jgi:hypothetical protein